MSTARKEKAELFVEEYHPHLGVRSLLELSGLFWSCFIIPAGDVSVDIM